MDITGPKKIDPITSQVEISIESRGAGQTQFNASFNLPTRLAVNFAKQTNSRCLCVVNDHS